MRAVESEDIPYMRTLLDTSGINVNKAGSFGYTALISAAGRDNVKCVEMLLNARGIEINKACSFDCTALNLAAQHGNIECVKMLLNARGIDVKKANDCGNTPLMTAARRGRVECVEVLSKVQGINLNTKDNNGYTALMLATSDCRVKCIEVLVNTPGIDVNEVSKCGYTALMLAAEYGYVDCVKALCNVRGINLNTKNDDGYIDLMLAERHDHVTELGYTALMLAAKKGHAKCVELLCNVRGIDVNMKNTDGATALMLAVKEAESSPMSAHLNCIEALIKHPEAVIDVKTRECILNLVIKECYPGCLPYLKLTEDEVQDFMFKIKELREEDKITPENYFILLIDLFEYGHVDISCEEVERKDSESMSTRLEPILNFQTSNGKENCLVPLKSIDNKILQEALERINANKKKLRPLSFLALNKSMDMSHVQTRPDGSVDDQILKQYSELEKVVMDYSMSCVDDKVEQIELAERAEQEKRAARKRPYERTEVDEKQEQRKIKKTTLVNEAKQTMDDSESSLADKAKGAARKRPCERTEVDEKQEQRKIKKTTLVNEAKQTMDDSESSLADKAKGAARKPCEQTSVDKTQEQEQRKIKEAILVNKAKQAMKAKQTMSELFVKMQGADRLGLLEKIPFSSQLEAYIKILSKIHTKDVSK